MSNDCISAEQAHFELRRPVPACIAAPAARFRNWSYGVDVDADGALIRLGTYEAYAMRTGDLFMGCFECTHSRTFWAPRVFFIPADPSLPPEVAYDTYPHMSLREPIYTDDTEGLPDDELKALVLAPVTSALRSLLRFYERTGQRYEVLRHRELDSCYSDSDDELMPQYPIEEAMH